MDYKRQYELMKKMVTMYQEEIVPGLWERIKELDKQLTKVETNVYDQEEIFPNCTVQVLTNTATGETSVGWWRNGN